MRATIEKLLALKYFTRKFAMFMSAGSSSDGGEDNHSNDESSKQCSDITGPDNPSSVQSR